jgi:hypothetical protein
VQHSEEHRIFLRNTEARAGGVWNSEVRFSITRSLLNDLGPDMNPENCLKKQMLATDSLYCDGDCDWPVLSTFSLNNATIEGKVLREKVQTNIPRKKSSVSSRMEILKSQ